MKIIITAAIALLIAAPAAGQTAPAQPDAQGHAQHQHGAEHAQHMQGHEQHGEHSQAQHHDGCCADRNGNGVMDCCEQAEGATAQDCCAEHSAEHEGHQGH